jgi:hypothetical protein
MCGLVSRSRSRRCAAVAQGGDSVAVEVIAVERAAGRGHDQGHGGAGYEWPGAGGEGAVGGRCENRSPGALPTPGGVAKGMAGARTISPVCAAYVQTGRIVFG